MNTSGKPQITEDYGGVDTFNEMMKSRTVRRKTQRWPLRALYFIVDAAPYNAYILYRGKNNVSRIDFLKRLSCALVEECTRKHLEIRNLPMELRTSITTLRKQAYLNANEKALTQHNVERRPISRCHTSTLEKGSERAQKKQQIFGTLCNRKR